MRWLIATLMSLFMVQAANAQALPELDLAKATFEVIAGKNNTPVMTISNQKDLMLFLTCKPNVKSIMAIALYDKPASTNLDVVFYFSSGVFKPTLEWSDDATLGFIEGGSMNAVIRMIGGHERFIVTYNETPFKFYYDPNEFLVALNKFVDLCAPK